MTIMLVVNGTLAAVVFSAVIVLLTRAIGRYGAPGDGPGPGAPGQAPVRLIASRPVVMRSGRRAEPTLPSH